MTSKQIDNRARKLEALEAEIKALEDQAEAVKAELKAELEDQGVEEINTGAFVIRWKAIISSRFDSKAMKLELPEIYSKYLKQTSSMRFTIA